MNNANYIYRRPFLGPRLAWGDPASDSSPLIQVMLDPAFESAQLLLLPAALKNGALAACDTDQKFIFALSDIKPRHWSEGPNFLDKPIPLDATGYVIVLAYGASLETEVKDLILNDVWAQLTCFYTAEELLDMYVPWFDVRVKETQPLSFAFGSCQYPAGLLDKLPAFASYERLGRRLAAASDERKPQFLLLLGDQIYSDATAGLLDPVRADDRFENAYQEFFSAAPVRNVLKQIPAQMMLDDHEIEDNWEPTSAKGAYGQHYRSGLDTYWRYQRGTSNHSGQSSKYFNSLSTWTSFLKSGFGFFMADSRSKRTYRNPENVKGDTTLILGEVQSLELEVWLKKQQQDYGNRPKFVTSASIVLPRHVAKESDALHLDGWEGYPSSLYRLLGFVFENGIQNVIFLSGDEHISCFTDIELSKVGQSNIVHAYSIHASALYAPIPFVNARPTDLRHRCQVPPVYKHV